MKRLNKERRELRPMNPGIYKWMADIPIKEQIVHVKSYANMQLRETLSVAQSNRMQIEVKIYRLKEIGKNFDEEVSLLESVDKNIKDINKAIKENDEYISEYFGGWEFE